MPVASGLFGRAKATPGGGSRRRAQHEQEVSKMLAYAVPSLLTHDDEQLCARAGHYLSLYRI